MLSEKSLLSRNDNFADGESAPKSNAQGAGNADFKNLPAPPATPPSLTDQPAQNPLVEERLYTTIFENAGLGLALVDISGKGRMLKVNPALSRMIGYSVEELCTKNVFEIAHPEVRAQNIKLHEDCIAGKIDSYSMEKRYIRKNGSEFWGKLTASIVRDSNGAPQYIIGVVEDIDAQKKAETNLFTSYNKLEAEVLERADELQRINASLEQEIAAKKQLESEKQSVQKMQRKIFAAMEASREGMAILDGDGLYTYMNCAHAKICGYETPDELIGHSWRLLYDEAVQKYFDVDVWPQLNQNQYWQGEVLSIRKDGSEFSQDVSLQLLKDGGLVCVCRDITERKQAAEKMIANEKMLRQSQAIADFGSFEWDIRENKVTWSEGLYNIYGLDSKTFGASFEAFLERIHPEDREIVQQTIMDAVAEKRSFRTEERVVRSDNEIRTLATKGEIILDDAGNPIRMIGVCHDITERKAAEEKIRASLQEKELLLREIHHRVKNNLQIISSLLNLQAALISDPAMRQMFSESQDRVRSMALIHEKLYQSQDMACIDFSAYVQSLASYLFRAYAGYSSNVRLDVQTHNVMLNIDVAIVCGLIINELMTNSLKYAFVDRSSGRITVELKRQSKNKALLAVRDDGPGPPEDLDVLSTNSLGLKLVRTLARQLQGEMKYYVQEGAIFELIFELKDDMSGDA